VSSTSSVEIRGLRLHNLHDVQLSVPLHALVGIVGVCGAGKSSLAFDTLFVEGRRRYVEALSTATRQALDALDRPDVDFLGDLPPTISVRQRFPDVSWRPTVGTVSEVLPVFRNLFTIESQCYCPRCGIPLPVHQVTEIAHHLRNLPAATRILIVVPYRPVVVSPNPAMGATPAEWLARGFSRVVLEGQVRPLTDWNGEITRDSPPLIVIDRLTAGADLSRWLESLELAYRFGNGQCLTLTQTDQETQGEFQHEQPRPPETILVEGRCWLRQFWSLHRICETCREFHAPAETALFCFNQKQGACPACHGTGRQSGHKQKAKSTRAKESADPGDCPQCQGRRFRSESLNWRWQERNLAEWMALSIDEFLQLWDELRSRFPNWDPFRRKQLELVERRLRMLSRLGLGYLNLGRPLRTLATGEAQRVRLAAALTIELVNLLYVLEEPAAGLAASQQGALLEELQKCRDLGHSVVLIEHDPALLSACDHLIELGPGAGADGGRVMYSGTPGGLAQVTESATGQVLRAWQTGASTLRPRSGRRPLGWLRIRDLHCQTVTDAVVRVPLGALTVITGISGSGKTSLLRAIASQFASSPPAATVFPDSQEPSSALPALPSGVVELPNAPIARNARLTAASFLQIAPAIRQLFAASPEAQGQNLGAGHFGLHAGAPGLCEECQGLGAVQIDLQFLPNVQTVCAACHGRRFRPEVLAIRYRGLSIAEVLALPIREALAFFRGQIRIQRRLKTLLDVGLDTLELGASAQRLSPAEVARLRLAEFLSRPQSGGASLLILDEPTRGLHPVDLARYLRGLDLATAAGHTVLLATHHRDLIQAAVWQIEVGPGAGPAGGRIVREGEPTHGQGSETGTSRR
jgi:excinuclease ABC subunit A